MSNYTSRDGFLMDSHLLLGSVVSKGDSDKADDAGALPESRGVASTQVRTMGWCECNQLASLGPHSSNSSMSLFTKCHIHGFPMPAALDSLK